MTVLPSLLKPWTPTESHDANPPDSRPAPKPWREMSHDEKYEYCRARLEDFGTHVNIGRETGVQAGSVQKFCSRWGLKTKVRRGQNADYVRSRWARLTDDERAGVIREGHSRGLSIPQVARELGCAPSNIYKFLHEKDLFLDFREQVPHYPDEVVARIYELAATGYYSTEGLAKELGLETRYFSRWRTAHNLKLPNKDMASRARKRDGKSTHWFRCRNPDGLWARAVGHEARRALAVEYLINRNMTMTEAGEALGIERSILSRFAVKHQIDVPKGPRLQPPTAEQEAQLRHLCSTPISQGKLIQEMGMGSTKIMWWIKELGLTQVTPLPVQRDPNAPRAPRPPRIRTERTPRKPREPRVKPPKPERAYTPPAPPPPPAVRPAMDAPNKVHFLADKILGRCRYPLWPDDGYLPIEEKFYCGEPTAHATTVYCENCLRLTSAKRTLSMRDAVAQFKDAERRQARERRSVYALRAGG